MSTEILRPNATGDETNLTPFGDGANWECVDEAITDDNSTFVYTSAADYQRDLYNLPASSGSGTIYSLRVYFRFRTSESGTAAYAKASIRTYDTNYYSIYEESQESSASWITRWEAWSTNPYTGLRWTWDEIDNNLEIGVSLHEDGTYRHAYCTQVYVEIYYASPPTVTNSTGADNITHNTARLHGEVTDTGGLDPTAIIYWGTIDGETTAGNWDNRENLGYKGAETFYEDIGGLGANTTYYYRCYAYNGVGNDWADSTESFTTSYTPFVLLRRKASAIIKPIHKVPYPDGTITVADRSMIAWNYAGLLIGVVAIALSLRERSSSLTLRSRSSSLSLRERSSALTLRPRSSNLTLRERSTALTLPKRK